MVATAAGQGVTITGEKPYNPWVWQNAVIFAATIITTIGYGQVAPKTIGGRVFCIVFGLCGIPLCFTWISELGTFFGSRTKRLSQALLHRQFSVKKVQFICTTLFLLWGLLFHLLIPPFFFMCVEQWTYLEGLYFCFITLTTVGFGDYVAGVNTGVDYQAPYRFCVELWIYMGLAWLSLFFSWNVHMVVKAHKVLKKRRQMHHNPSSVQLDQIHKASLPPTARIVDIFKFMSEKGEDYSDVIQAIGTTEKKKKQEEEALTRSKSCSELLKQVVVPLEPSLCQKRRFSIGDNVYMVISRARGSAGDLEVCKSLQMEMSQDLGLCKEKCSEKEVLKRAGSSVWDSRNSSQRSFQIPSFRFSYDNDDSGTQEGTSRFSVTKVNEDLLKKGEGPG